MRDNFLVGPRKIHPLYNIWKNMRNDRCDEWDDFEFFVCEVGIPAEPSKLMRVDKTQPFSLDNVVWVTNEEAHTGANNPNYRGGMLTTTCATCGKDIYHHPALSPKYCSKACVPRADRTHCAYCGAQTGSRTNKYCSADCKRKSIAAKWSEREGKDASEYKPKNERRSDRVSVKVRKLCPVCGKIFSCYKNQIYCGRECYGKAVGLRQQGEKHHMWKGGVTVVRDRVRKHPLYKQWRTDVFVRDDYTCQSCFVKSGDLRAHHIVEYRHDPKKRLKKSNGITLCDRCHKLFHSYSKKGLFEGKESALQTKCNDMFRAAGFFVFNTHGGPMQMAGMPDSIMCFMGRMVCVEYKVHPNFLTPLQQMHRKGLQRTGSLYFMVRSEDDAARIIDEMKDILL